MGPSPHRGGHGGGSVAGKAEVRPGRVLVGGIVPGAASGGRKTGIAWAFRGLSLAFHGGAIAAAVAVAGPQPAAVIEAYTVEIVYSDRLAGGHGEGTDMPPAPSPAGSAKAAGLADPSTADRAMAGLRAADPAAPGISLSDAVPVPDPAPPAEVAGPPEGAPSPGAAGASPAYRSRGDTPLVPPGAAGASPAYRSRGDTPLVPPGAAGASPAYRSRGDTPLVPPEAADPADAEPPTALDPPNVLPAAGPTSPVLPAAGPTPPEAPIRESRPGARARLPGLPPRKPRVPQRPPEIAETSPAPAQPSADAAAKAPPAKPAPATPLPDTPVGTSPPQLETVVASAAPGDAPAAPGGTRGVSPRLRYAGDAPAAPVAPAPGLSSREAAGGAKRAVSAASYTAGHLGNVPPVYPYRARRKEIEGRVVLRVQVLPGGTALSVELLSSSGHAILDRAALRAVRAWRFVPARRGGVPVADAIDVPISFRLAD